MQNVLSKKVAAILEKSEFGVIKTIELFFCSLPISRRVMVFSVIISFISIKESLFVIKKLEFA